MILSQNSKPQTDRHLIEDLNTQFADLDQYWCSLLDSCDDETLYLKGFLTRNDGSHEISIGEMIRRSAALVEQMCGGLLSNLWDDPFEWTLPETLSTRASISEYLAEVRIARERTFSTFTCDSDLSRTIVVPSGEMCTLRDLLSQTLWKASESCRVSGKPAESLGTRDSSRFII
ncbi:MAG: hypothetical protein C5B44_02195 [Acidobacteria bacterium]|nr:MAG: hypothetical protein C5B44_02195 [Acidobacteriota bacterium]